MSDFISCPDPGHEAVGDDEQIESLDQATHLVTITGPKGAVEANDTPEEVCIGCAGKLAEAYIGFGWDVEVRSLDR